MHFRILKMIATSGFLAALKCTKFAFSWGSAPDPAGGVDPAGGDYSPSRVRGGSPIQIAKSSSWFRESYF